MKNLTELKHYLTLPNAALRTVSLEWFMNGEWVTINIKPEHKNFRFVGKLQTNAVGLETDTESGLSWLQFGKASEWAFDKSISMITKTSDGTRISYKWANLAIVEGTKEWERLTATA